ncbi:MAG: hypothetical protein PHU33_09755 [Bacteroidales bacterium]|nr:hypothetical protein [Bacteroidales bacterium]
MKKVIIISIVCCTFMLSCSNSCVIDSEFKLFYFNMLDTISSYGKQFNTDKSIILSEERCGRFSDISDYMKLLTNHELRYTIIEQPIYQKLSDLESDIFDLKNWYEENKCGMTKAKADSIVKSKK